MKREDVIKILDLRINHFDKKHHSFEADELRKALSSIKRLIPPSMFDTNQKQPLQSAEEFLSNKGFMNYALQHPETWKFHSVSDLMEAYANQKQVSDEEIEKESKNNWHPYQQNNIESFIRGAKWMRDKLTNK